MQDKLGSICRVNLSLLTNLIKRINPFLILPIISTTTVTRQGYTDTFCLRALDTYHKILIALFSSLRISELLPGENKLNLCDIVPPYTRLR